MQSLAASSDVSTIATSDDAHTKRSRRKRKQREQTSHESLGGAIVRSLFGTLAFLFKRPVRLFRPVKLSSWTILEAMAKREGRSGISIRYLRSLLRRENSSFLPHLLLPPLLFNTAIGFTLFEAYSITESRLLARSKSSAHHYTEHEHQWTPLWIVTLSGAVAGAAQCFLSAPLDNVRYIMQQNVSPQGSSHGRKRAGAHTPAKPVGNISWRAILRAAILPFAPAIARDRLVQAVHHDTIKTSTTPTPTSVLIDKIRSIFLGKANSASQQQQQKFGLSPDRRQQWEKRLKRWRGGIHGSGLALSLIRDSVGFGSFFFIFEVSRRCAFYASTSVDKLSAFFNGRGLGIVLPTRQEGDVRVQNVGDWNKQGRKNADDADFSYNESRTVQGRVVAVIILLVGGAVGALSYELLGRPFELMRVVIWEGRKQWEQGKREPEARVHKQKPHKAATQTKSRPKSSNPVRQNGPTLLRARDARRTIVRRASHVHPARDRHRALALHAPSFAKLQQKAARIMSRTKTHAEHRPTRGRKRVAVKPASDHIASHAVHHTKYPSPTLATRPGALTLLLEHAQATIKLDKKYGAPDAAKMSKPVMLAHTYFIAPFLPEIPKLVLENKAVREAAGVNKQLRPTQDNASTNAAQPTFTTVAQKTLHMSLASRRRAVAESPEDKVKRNWVRNNPVNSSFAKSQQPKSDKPPSSVLARLGGQGASDNSTLQRGTRYWASGRVTWALKRLATPYGVAFLVFAWLGGDLN